MKVFKKRTVVALALLASSVALSSCHGRSYIPTFTLPASFDTETNYEISFWAKNDNNINQVNIYQKAIDEFEKIYPNINVSLRNFSSYPDLYREIITNIGTNTTPNVSICYPDHVASYLENPTMIVDLDTIVDDARYGLGGSEVKFNSPSLNNFVLKYIEEGYLKGNTESTTKLYTLPFMRSNEVLYYNKDWIETNKADLIARGIKITDDLELTWTDFWNICRYAKEQNTNSSFVPLVYQSEDNFFIELAKQYGYDYTTEEGEVLFVNDGNMELMNNLNSYYKEGLLIMKNNTGSYPGDKMNVGEAIFGIDSSAGSTWIGPDAPMVSKVDNSFEVGVTILPQADLNNMYTMSQGPSLCLFNKENEQETLASWLFLQYLTTKDVQISYAKTEGYSPVTNEAINSTEYKSYLEAEDTYYVQRLASNAVVKYQNNAFVTPAFTGSSDVRAQVGNIVKAVTVSKSKVIDIKQLFDKALQDAGY